MKRWVRLEFCDLSVMQFAVSSSASSERCCVAEVEHISEPEAAVKIAAADKQTVAAKTEAKDAKETPVKKTEAKDAKETPAAKTEAKDAKETPAELKVDVAYLAKVRRVAWSERWVRLHL